MNARMRRVASDWEQLRKDFANHPYIKVTPMGGEPPERYHVTYFVNGIFLLPDGSVQTQARHDVEITLHAEYPRYKPLCKILTPIWPEFPGWPNLHWGYLGRGRIALGYHHQHRRYDPV